MLNPLKEPDHINEKAGPKPTTLSDTSKRFRVPIRKQKRNPFVLRGNEIEYYEIHQPHHILGQNLGKSPIVTTTILTAY